MAHDSGSFNLDLQKQCVTIAIRGRGNQPEPVARGLSLGPKLVASTAEKGYVAGVERAVARFAIHEAEHQHLTGCRVLRNGRRQALHLVKVNFETHGYQTHRYFL